MGLAWEPARQALWVSVNERDEIGSDLVPDYMTAVKDGVFYGWPFSYYGRHVAVDKRGGLLVVDDIGNTVWRVTGAGR